MVKQVSCLCVKYLYEDIFLLPFFFVLDVVWLFNLMRCLMNDLSSPHLMVDDLSTVFQRFEDRRQGEGYKVHIRFCYMDEKTCFARKDAFVLVLGFVFFFWLSTFQIKSAYCSGRGQIKYSFKNF